jgi:hypothetical protein
LRSPAKELACGCAARLLKHLLTQESEIKRIPVAIMPWNPEHPEKPAWYAAARHLEAPVDLQSFASPVRLKTVPERIR